MPSSGSTRKTKGSRKLRTMGSGTWQILRRRPLIRHLPSKNAPQIFLSALGTARAVSRRMSDDGRLDDEQPMPETLDSLGAKIAALGKQIDTRFVQVGERF